jgi:hypothetical protein
VASITTRVASEETAKSARNYEVKKYFYDYAENIEAVNIHYACTPVGEVPDWNSQRATLFMPLLEDRLRRTTLKLPARILDSRSGEVCDRYLLHHYFEIFVDGDTHYSPLFTEEVCTGAGPILASSDASTISMGRPVSELAQAAASTESSQIPEPEVPPVASNKKRTRAKAKKGQ